ncbi:MAG: DUF3108 domain-containing protein [Pseudomonadota bacterium]
MWNKVAQFIRDGSTKKLALAIVVSTLLHAYMVGNFDVRLPSFKQENNTIEARLQMPQVVKKDVVKDVTVNEIIADALTESVAVPISEAIKQSAPDLESLPADFVPEDFQSTRSEPAPQPISDVVSSTSGTAETEPQPTDEGLVINENAYPYVETNFDVRTQIDGASEGRAKIVFNVTDGKQYQLTSLIKPDGLAALIISDLLQTSTGQLTKSGLQPDSYLYQYGNKTNKTYAAKFDWQTKTVNLITSKGTKTAVITDGAQDLLSFMYQFMYVAPLERMQISIATGKKLSSYNYSFSGEESINIPLGEIKALHIFHEGENSDEKTELWLAVDYQYLPVKIRKIEKNGKVYELVANHINTARPTLN